jgi:hypothetical protein
MLYYTVVIWVTFFSLIIILCPTVKPLETLMKAELLVSLMEQKLGAKVDDKGKRFLPDGRP